MANLWQSRTVLNAFDFHFLSTGQVPGLIPDLDLESMQPRITSLYEDSSRNLVISEFVPRMTVPKYLSTGRGEGSPPGAIGFTLPTLDQIRPAKGDRFSRHGAHRHAIVLGAQCLTVDAPAKNNSLARFCERAGFGQGGERNSWITPSRFVTGGRMARVNIVDIWVIEGAEGHAVFASPDGRAAFL